MSDNTAHHHHLYTRLVSNWVFPIHERLKGHATASILNQLEKSQWWSGQELKALQLHRLQKLLGHACTRVPYYRELFNDLSLDVRDVKSLRDLEQLPFLTKERVRTCGEELKADDAEKLIRFNTGGSSGEPLIFYIGKTRISADIAAKWRATRWWDLDIGDREIVIWGSPIELDTQDRMRALRDRVFRTKLLPAFEMSDDHVCRYLNEISKGRPKMLFGYPSAIAYIADYARRHGISMNDIGIDVAFVTAERLYDEQRNVIESVFNCRVANGYGGRDSGFIAHECQHRGMHIASENVIVEIVDENGNQLPKGAVGEIVVTQLENGDVPFIRYKTGDVAALDERMCPCGRGLPLIKEIQGRTTDFVVAADGTVMHGLALIYILRDLPGIAAFKIIQEDVHLTRVLLVHGEGFDKTCIEKIQDGFKSRLGAHVRIEIERVARIPGERSGKFRYVVSKCHT